MSQVSTLDIILFIAAVFYGVVLFLSGFMNNKFIEGFRLDTFFMPKPSPRTKMANIFFGIAVIGIAIYSFIGSFK